MLNSITKCTLDVSFIELMHVVLKCSIEMDRVHRHLSQQHFLVLYTTEMGTIEIFMTEFFSFSFCGFACVFILPRFSKMIFLIIIDKEKNLTLNEVEFSSSF